MTLSGQEVWYIMTVKWNDMREQRRNEVMEWRRRTLARVDGDLLNPIYQWPRYIRRILFQTAYPIGDRQTFTLYLFFVGNGVAPLVFGKWILSSIALVNWQRRDRIANKRIQQMKWIQNNLANHVHDWRYFDLERRRIVYFNGVVYHENSL